MELEKKYSETEDRIRALFNECITKTRRVNDITDTSYVFDNQIESAKEIIYNLNTYLNLRHKYHINQLANYHSDKRSNKARQSLFLDPTK